jgi:hypothetical protein
LWWLKVGDQNFHVCPNFFWANGKTNWSFSVVIESGGD